MIFVFKQKPAYELRFVDWSSGVCSADLRTPFVPGTVSPVLAVPSKIERPEYAWKPTAKEGNEPWVQTPETIEAMRIASKIAAGALQEAGKAVAPEIGRASRRERE